MQAVGLTTYITLFATTANFVRQWFDTNGIKPPPVLGISMFLLAFVTSAFICVSIAFIYPGFLFFENKKSEAVKVILWTLVWLIIFFSVYFTSTVLLF